MQPAPARLTPCDAAGRPLTGAPAVHLLPAPPPVPGAPPERQRQRQRAAARQALAAELAAWLGLAPADIVLSDARGQAPCARRQDGAALPAIGLSIGHEAALSLLAWWPGGAVGVDVVRLPAALTRREMAALRQTYFGQERPAAVVESSLSAIELRAFALDWAIHEARLKAAGLALTEWTPALEARLAGWRCAELPLPAWAAGEHVAALAWAAPPR